MNSAPGKLEDKPGDLAQARLTYAWEWFKYHASQRVSMFNYFLIITGIFANAYVAMLKDGSKQVLTIGGMALGAIGALTAIGFVVLDVRNSELVKRGSGVLNQLEKGPLFGELRLTNDSEGRLMLRHTGWIRLIEIVIAICFLALAVFAGPIADAANVGTKP